MHMNTSYFFCASVLIGLAATGFSASADELAPLSDSITQPNYQACPNTATENEFRSGILLIKPSDKNDQHMMLAPNEDRKTSPITPESTQSPSAECTFSGYSDEYGILWNYLLSLSAS